MTNAMFTYGLIFGLRPSPSHLILFMCSQLDARVPTHERPGQRVHVFFLRAHRRTIWGLFSLLSVVLLYLTLHGLLGKGKFCSILAFSVYTFYRRVNFLLTPAIISRWWHIFQFFSNMLCT